jgi:hypothetical protein
MTSKGGFIGAIFNAARFDRVDVDHPMALRSPSFEPRGEPKVQAI